MTICSLGKEIECLAHDVMAAFYAHAFEDADDNFRNALAHERLRLSGDEMKPQ